MSDRIKGLTVILEKDYRDDSIDKLIEAISHFRGVLKVRPIKAEASDFIERARIRNELTEKLWAALNEDKP